MLIPIGHDQQTVRRLPWVTIVIVACNLLCFVLVASGAKNSEALAAKQIRRVFEYWQERPYLNLPDDLVDAVVPPAERARFRTLMEAMKGGSIQVDAAERELHQRVLDEMARDALAAREAHPFFAWGLVPAKPRLAAFLSSMFMHAGWLHLLGNMFILYLAGPPIEDAYGRPGFAALYGLAGVAASLAHMAYFPDAAEPLVGASGAVAGVMGAFLIRCTRSKIRFFYWWFVRGGTFDAPAWLMLPLWLLQQLFYASLTKGGDGVAYWAHVGGFVFGALAALVVKWLRIEERYIHPKIEAAITLEQHPALQRGLELLARGAVEDARRAFGEAMAADPHNPDVHLAMWQSYLQVDEPRQGAGELVKVIELELRGGELDLALDHWRELVASAGVGGPATLRFRLASQLAEAGRVEANEVFRHLAEDPTADLLGEKARRRLGLPEPPPPAEPLPSRPPSREDGAAGEGGMAARVREAAAAVGEVPERAETPLWVEENRLVKLEEAGLALKDAAGVGDVLLYSLVDAVAVGGIAGADRPYLVMDLVVGFNTDRRRVFRVRSTAMDPSQLLEWFDAPPLEAFRELVRRIVDASGATLLPGPEAIAKIRMFESLGAFEVEVYGVDREQGSA